MKETFKADLNRVKEVAEMIIKCVGCGNFFEDCNIETSFDSSHSWEDIVEKLNSIKEALIEWEGDNETAWRFYANEQEIHWQGQWTSGREVSVMITDTENEFLVDCFTGNGKQVRDSFLLSYLTK
ncbi:MAG: hypothetical protein GX025_10265 [Clostridiales bacterium]|nr:hypothetical protein [Clostridiales bacterium]